MRHIYIYIYMCVGVGCFLFGPVKSELGVIPSGQKSHSKVEHLNFPGKRAQCNQYYRAILYLKKKPLTGLF